MANSVEESLDQNQAGSCDRNQSRPDDISYCILTFAKEPLNPSVVPKLHLAYLSAKFSLYTIQKYEFILRFTLYVSVNLDVNDLLILIL